MARAIILMLDSLGVGYSADADKYGDVGANTLGHIINAFPDIKINHLKKLGLLNILASSDSRFSGIATEPTPQTYYGYGVESSLGKDTPSGHWELMGCPVDFEWGYFHDKENSFPQELLEIIYKKANLKGSLGNCAASGTEIIAKYGMEHCATKMPIFYTSADSVFQIACHEEIFGLENLYNLCKIAREELYKYNIGRVIARPFIGNNSNDFIRTGNRKDYSIEPHKETLLEVMQKSGGEVVAIGKISDIFAAKGVTKYVKASKLNNLFDATVGEIKNTNNDSVKNNSIIFTNFVDFDSEYGHRRDVKGYKEAIEYFDSRINEIINMVTEEDLVVIVADHGCDPTWAGSDHTREHVPIIFYNKKLGSKNIGKRWFSDVGQSIATFLKLKALENGINFL